MATIYQTPGAYYERFDAGVPQVSPLRTDIPAFIGIARRGPLHAPVPVESWKQFVAYFGDMTGAGYLAYAVRAFFENEGRRCWVVRVSSEIAASSYFDFNRFLPTPAPVWRISASSPGVWGDQLAVSLRLTHQNQAVANPSVSKPEYVVVNSVSGFERGAQVRVRISPGLFEHRVVAATDAETSRLYWINPTPALRLPNEAILTGYNLQQPLLIESIEYTLLVREGARVVAEYEGLSPSTSHRRYGPRVLRGIPIWHPGSTNWHLSETPDPVRIDELRSASELNALTLFDTPAEAWVPLQGGLDGLSGLSIKDFIGEIADPLVDDSEAQRRLRGLACLEEVQEPALVAMPDIHIQPDLPPEYRPLPLCVPDPCLPLPPPGPALLSSFPVGDTPPRFSEGEIFSAQIAMVHHCESRRDRIALLDPPYFTARDDCLGIAAIRSWRKRFDTKFAALYFPWLKVVDPVRLGGRLTRAIPPSGHVAGFCAQTDWRVGVHKAPANGSLGWVQDVTSILDDTAHGVLNEEGVNLIRAYPGRGIRIVGARTISSDPDWRYVNVRRLLIMIEKSLFVACQWAVFEPNDFRTRTKLHLSFTSFLMALWQRGALVGNTPAEAFFVKCNESNNPSYGRARGELVAEIGVAPAKPFEFVALRVGRSDNQFEISEAAATEGAL